jgi:iron complex outermembrane receptor protein
LRPGPRQWQLQQANAQISVTTGGNQEREPETSESYAGRRLQPVLACRASRSRPIIRDQGQGRDPGHSARTTVLNCLLTNDPATCGLVTRVNGELIEIEGFLQNIAAIKTDGIDVNLAYRGLETGFGRFGFTWNNTFLLNYDVIVPGPTGPEELTREGTQVGSPSQSFPKYKSVAVVDLDWTGFGVSVIGRYVSKLRELGGNVMNSVFLHRSSDALPGGRG